MTFLRMCSDLFHLYVLMLNNPPNLIFILKLSLCLLCLRLSAVGKMNVPSSEYIGTVGRTVYVCVCWVDVSPAYFMSFTHSL